MIVVDEISKRFGEVTALHRVSLRVESGERVAVLGPSGSGKTTLLRLIAGLDTVDEGQIHLHGQLASEPGLTSPPHQRGIGFVFQSPALWPHMTVAQNILFGLGRLPKGEAQRRMQDLLARIGMNGLARRYPHQLSGGEARRVALARTLAPRPRYLLMDEPLTNLDPTLKADLLELIEQHLKATEASLIYVTHSADEAMQLAHRVYRLESGRIAPQEALPDGP